VSDTVAIFPFTHDHGNTSELALKAVLGGKGANLNRMVTTMGLPVPEGFTITTSACDLHAGATKLNPALKKLLTTNVKALNKATGRTLGDPSNPLLVSVRSGAPISMPGMMETILNLGINDDTVHGLARLTNEQFAWDAYRRFLQMYAITVFGMDHKVFTERLEAAKAFGAGMLSTELLQRLVANFKRQIGEAGFTVPQDVNEQLNGAILAVFSSWTADKAVAYREIEGIPHDLGTAVNVQRMVFGNMNDNSGTGVGFTRNPNTGDNRVFGDFLVNAQGEDVVDGSHVTLPIGDMKHLFNEQYEQLLEIMSNLEAEFHDMCDIEFTIEDGKLFMLQTRAGKRSPKAALRIAVEMAADGLIDSNTAMERIEAAGTVATVDDDDDNRWEVIGSGLGASPGTVIGKAVFKWKDAVEARENDPECSIILVRPLTSPDDVKGMAAANAILTAQGGLVSHAAVVARGWGKPCVVSAEFLSINTRTKEAKTSTGQRFGEGDLIKIDGETGEVSVVQQ
jgi:pyruvate, orthophosphate dikinase